MAKLVQVKHMVTIMHTADMSATPDVVIAGLLALPKGDESCILPPTHSFAEYGAALSSRRLLDAFLATAHAVEANGSGAMCQHVRWGQTDTVPDTVPAAGVPCGQASCGLLEGKPGISAGCTSPAVLVVAGTAVQPCIFFFRPLCV